MVTEQALKMLETALEMEARGKRFYAEAVETCKNPFGRAVFQKLLDDEAIHTARIQNIWRAVRAGADWSSEVESLSKDQEGVDTFFRSLVAGTNERIQADSNDLKALEVGIEFETRAATFYEGALRESADGLVSRFLQRMVAEERGHASALNELRQYLVDPDAWFARHENLDG